MASTGGGGGKREKKKKKKKWKGEGGGGGGGGQREENKNKETQEGSEHLTVTEQAALRDRNLRRQMSCDASQRQHCLLCLMSCLSRESATLNSFHHASRHVNVWAAT